MTHPTLARIRIIDKDGNDLFDTTDKNELENLGIKIDEEWKNIYRLNVGTIIPRIDGQKLKITNISTNLYTLPDKLDLNIGVNSSVYGEAYPFNFEVVYETEPV